ncbi:MAG: hypothetical protein ACR2OI_12170, partial [Acidimicrobiia bacterium]
MARIGAWALAAITAAVAALNGQVAAADDPGDLPPEGVPGAAEVGLISQVVPAAPANGLLVVRYQPSPLPPPPTLV